MTSFDTREWRVGTKYGVIVYAVNPGDDRDGDEAIASFLGNPESARARAEQMVAEHAMLSAPYADEQHQGGHWLDVLPQKPRWATGPEGLGARLPLSSYEADEQTWRVHDLMRRLARDVRVGEVWGGKVAEQVDWLADKLTSARWRPKAEGSTDDKRE